MADTCQLLSISAGDGEEGGGRTGGPRPADRETRIPGDQDTGRPGYQETKRPGDDI